MRWTGCLRFTLKGSVVSWVVSSQDLRLSTGNALADIETSAAMFIVYVVAGGEPLEDACEQRTGLEKTKTTT